MQHSERGHAARRRADLCRLLRFVHCISIIEVCTLGSRHPTLISPTQLPIFKYSFTTINIRNNLLQSWRLPKKKGGEGWRVASGGGSTFSINGSIQVHWAASYKERGNLVDGNEEGSSSYNFYSPLDKVLNFICLSFLILKMRITMESTS